MGWLAESHHLLTSFHPHHRFVRQVIRGESVGRRADIWSLGCLVIQMAGGRTPWAEVEALNAFSLMYRIASAEALPALPEALPDMGREFVLRCLQRDPSDRPTASCLLAHPFLSEVV